MRQNRPILPNIIIIFFLLCLFRQKYNVGFRQTASLLFAFIMYSFVIPHIILKAKEYGLLCCCYCWFPSVCLISWTETLTLKRNNPIYRCGARPNKTFIAVSFFYPSHVFCIHWFNLFDIFHDVFPKKKHQFIWQDSVTKSILFL